MAFYHNLITDKSFQVLQELRKNYDFILIGGWAVYFYTKSLKSKDIDIIVSLETLSRLKQNFDISKNERLSKYEIKLENLDIDIYTPFWSNLGLDINLIMQNTITIEGFSLPRKEILLTLKLFAYRQRKNSLKGMKDKIDIISLLYFNDLPLKEFDKIIKQNSLEYLREELRNILETTIEMDELNINQKRFSDFKKSILNFFKNEK